MDHEVDLIMSFIRPEKKARWLELRRDRKGRAKLRQQLFHLNDLDPRFASEIDAGLSTPERLAEELFRRGAAPTCYLWCTNRELDGRQLELRTTLAELMGSPEGALVLCVPGRLGYYNPEDCSRGYLLERPR